VTSALTNPALWAQLAVFLTALAGLLKVLQVQKTTQESHDIVTKVQSQTDGVLTALQQNNADLRAPLATQAELANRPAPPPAPPAESPPAPPAA
jgi:hypothetical protein